MSRRRLPEVGSSSVQYRNQTQRQGKRLFPADLCAIVGLVDPGGHRLVSLGRYFHDEDPEHVWYSSNSIGPTTLMEYEASEAEEWTRLWFTCKTCRDQGKGFVSTIAMPAVVAEVTRAWRAGKTSDTPTRWDLPTVAADGYAVP